VSDQQAEIEVHVNPPIRHALPQYTRHLFLVHFFFSTFFNGRYRERKAEDEQLVLVRFRVFHAMQGSKE
jgi:hypothetical protein